MNKGGWRRRADSNRRIEVLQTSALDHLATSPRRLFPLHGAPRYGVHPLSFAITQGSGGRIRCRGRDLNPHRLSPTTPSRWRVYHFHHLGWHLLF